MSRKKAPALGPEADGAQRAVVRVPGALQGERLDRALAALVDRLSRSRARKVIGMGAVYLGTERCRVASRKVFEGDVLTATWHPEVSQAERFPLEVVHLDDAIVVVDKPSGQLSQGTELGDVGSLIWSLTRRFGEHVRLMHRLDKPASGLLLAARHRGASASLTPQFRDHTLDRRYLAVTSARPAEGLCELPLKRDGRRVRVATEAEPGARSARSRIEVLQSTPEAHLVGVTLETGRTHQIRAHLAALAAPIVGDRLYGGTAASRLCLHAAKLGFVHPEGHRVCFESSPGDDFWAAAGSSLTPHESVS